MKIYALGPEGTYGHEAAQKLCYRRTGFTSAVPLFMASHADVFTAVLATASMGIVAVENSIEGYVAETIRGFWLKQQKQPGILVVGELTLPIRHCLMARVKNIPKPGSRVLSHPQALGQCREHLATWNSVGALASYPTSSTAHAARLVAMDVAHAEDYAIASHFAAAVYGLEVLEADFGDLPGNATRFHVLGTQIPPPTGRDRTAMVFWLPNQPRRLVRALIAIAGENGINMSSLHSLPLGDKGKFAFYVEFEEHIHSEHGRQVLQELEKVTERILLLGSYPQE